MKNQKIGVALILMLITVLIWLAFFWQPMTTPDANQARTHTRLQVAEAPTGGDFTLQSPAGPVALKDYRGKVVILYFGYTFCPDVCPTSLASMAQALSALTPEELTRVVPFFISVDPERDTMDVLKTYVPFFHPSMTGLSGTPEQVAGVARQYGARYMKQKPDVHGLYAVDHSASTYLVAPDGRLADTLPHGLPAQQMLEKIRTLLKP